MLVFLWQPWRNCPLSLQQLSHKDVRHDIWDKSVEQNLKLPVTAQHLSRLQWKPTTHGQLGSCALFPTHYQWYDPHARARIYAPTGIVRIHFPQFCHTNYIMFQTGYFRYNLRIRLNFIKSHTEAYKSKHVLLRTEN